MALYFACYYNPRKENCLKYQAKWSVDSQNFKEFDQLWHQNETLRLVNISDKVRAIMKIPSQQALD